MVQYLSSRDQEERVSDILAERGRYVLVELKVEGKEKIVEPLLKNWVPKSLDEETTTTTTTTTTTMPAHLTKTRKDREGVLS